MVAPVVVQTPKAQAYDLPIIGDDLSKIGRIIDLWANPCSPEGELWVYGFFSNLPTLFISLYKPELIDIDIKKGSHRPRKGKRLRFNATRVLTEQLFTVEVPNWRVFKLYEWAQRIGWYFLVADMTEDFAINWMSTAYMWAGCPGLPGPYGVKIAQNWAASSNASPQKLTWPGGVFDQMIPTPYGYIVSEPGMYRAAWNLRFFYRLTATPPYGPETIWLVYQEANGTVTPITPFETGQGTGDDRMASGSTQVLIGETGGEFYVMVQSQNPKVWAMEGNLTITDIRNEPTRPDP